MSRVLILGCGYTGTRVARRLLDRGVAVDATSTELERLAPLAAAGVRLHRVDSRDPDSVDALAAHVHEAGPGWRVLHSVPTVAGAGGEVDPTPALLAPLSGALVRVVHISTTGVYGDASTVDETTPAAPRTPRQRLRYAAEVAAAAGPWATLVLRAAAIYGPGRGVHASMRTGRFRFVGDGSNVISRIHVDDLAALCAAALFADLTGAYPVADDAPARSREVAELCAGLLGLPLPAPGRREEVSETLQADRRVDGRAIRRLLGVELRFASYRAGIPAALAAEEAEG